MTPARIKSEVIELKYFAGGKWKASRSQDRHEILNPAKGKAIAEVPYCTAEEVDEAVEAAAAAFPGWRDTTIPARVRILFRYRELLDRHEEQLTRMVTREHGKTLEEARGSVRRGIEVVEFACGIPSLLMGEAVENVGRGVDTYSIRQPLGVCAGIPPFNFPAMVPMWMFPLAIACGNTFVLKPSEKVPMTAVRLAELFTDAGLPEGVLNLVHGAKQVVDRLLEHPKVKAVSFVGSCAVAKYVYATAAAHGKRVQALGGAKNHIVVMPDADIPQAAEAIIGSAFGCAGERCLAGSVVVAVGAVAGPLMAELKQRAARLVTGDGAARGIEMGPVITAAHRERVLKYIEIGEKEGAKLVLDGRRSLQREGFFLAPTLFDEVRPGSTLHREEIFGPVLSCVRVPDLESALAVVNSSELGNASSIFSNDAATVHEYCSRVEAGMIGVNVGVAAPLAFMPFSGWKGSFYGDLHAHGKDAVRFYTEQKVITSRFSWKGSARKDSRV
ncbi:MAG TPA: CoA-acylating methylmalonate-semialdehyde dehydrogenase [Terriglobia bacterium]|nr:CoA-acylating methylmalonate-semialdehyde dehydrogenase [Terriglobia bacterium]